MRARIAPPYPSFTYMRHVSTRRLVAGGPSYRLQCTREIRASSLSEVRRQPIHGACVHSITNSGDLMVRKEPRAPTSKSARNSMYTVSVPVYATLISVVHHRPLSSFHPAHIGQHSSIYPP